MGDAEIIKQGGQGGEQPDSSRLRPERFTTDELFRGATEIVIAHREALYRLKITRQGKLVLNK